MHAKVASDLAHVVLAVYGCTDGRRWAAGSAGRVSKDGKLNTASDKGLSQVKLVALNIGHLQGCLGVCWHLETSVVTALKKWFESKATIKSMNLCPADDGSAWMGIFAEVWHRKCKFYSLLKHHSEFLQFQSLASLHTGKCTLVQMFCSCLPEGQWLNTPKTPPDRVKNFLKKQNKPC